ncbi:OmpW family protein [Caballeronia sp. Lep1P3]|uniref:OmpW/AlkL family protein n=1 Tax=Caballeronia sp. Lep1P3 TaxID=2878150 RepID=UPI001FD1CB3B|nr:OmpW family outer membrane protein [Caballeronia sp. Lep1P3]
MKQIACAAAAALCVTGAHAQAAGDVVVNAGWMHFAPQDSSGPFKINARGQTMTQPGAGASVSDADTFAITTTYFATDHIAAEAIMGVPPKFNLYGTGTLAPFGKLGSAREWSPTLLLKYYFGSAQSRFRPYVAAGGSYVWFSDEKLTSGMGSGAFLYSPQFGRALEGPTNVKISSSFAPVANAGFTYNFSQHWSASFSVSYMWLSARARIETQSAVGTVRSESKIKLDPVVTFLSVGYRF